MISRSDKESLIEQIITENRAQFLFIASNYAPREDVMDLYQEIVGQIWRSLDRYESRSSLRTWVYSVALNTAGKFRRKEHRLAHAMRKYLFSRSEPVPRTADPRDEAAILREFLLSLDKADRGVFVLFLGGRSYQEISEITGLAEGTLRVRISRIKSRFQERYVGK